VRYQDFQYKVTAHFLSDHYETIVSVQHSDLMSMSTQHCIAHSISSNPKCVHSASTKQTEILLTIARKKVHSTSLTSLMLALQTRFRRLLHGSDQQWQKAGSHMCRVSAGVMCGVYCSLWNADTLAY